MLEFAVTPECVGPADGNISLVDTWRLVRMLQWLLRIGPNALDEMRQ